MYVGRLIRCAAGLMALVAGVAHLPAQEIGPVSGTLLIAGGGNTSGPIFERFIELAGRPAAVIVVIPTAGGRQRYDQDWSGLARLRAAGAQNLTVLHTIDPKVADTEAFVEPLKGADGVWISGGRQWRLVDAYLGTRVLAELVALHRRGGVIGGTSAGATILEPVVVRAVALHQFAEARRTLAATTMLRRFATATP